jgi:predicted RNase H-like HicB family nuclease
LVAAANELRLKAQMRDEVFNVLVEKDEDGYFVASVIELPGCHTQAKTLDELTSRIREAIDGYVKVSDYKTGPQFVGVHQLRMKLSK